MKPLKLEMRNGKRKQKISNTMNNDTSKIVLTLLLINKGEPLNNSYKIMRILEWKFKEIDSKKILDEVKERGFAEYKIVNGLHYYELSSFGREFIANYQFFARDRLLEHYPAEADFITNLFSGFG